MKYVTTVSRRDFLIGSTAIAGGVAFGGLVMAQEGADGAVKLNPWVVITPEEITLVTPHADIGQGVVSIQAALIAEELDVDFGQFETTFGAPLADYVNTGLAEEFVPYEGHDRSEEAMAARAGAEEFIISQGALMHMTGGSSTVANTYERLRKAGAVARETLKAVASARTGTPVADLKTKSGAVILPDGAKIPYAELAAEAAAVPPVEGVTLRDKSEWRLLGKPMQRIDIADKSTGELKFGIDQAVDGMVFAAVKLNPYKGAAINSFDASKAESLPGVDRVMKITNGVAAVASNSWYAMKAAESVQCDFAAGDYPPDQSQHWEVMENSFVPEHLDNVWRDEGDVEGAFESGAEVVSAEYRAPYVAHQPLEPINAIVRVTDNATEVWVGTQVPGIVRNLVAELTGMPLEAVTVYNQYSGGSFGHRLELENIRATTEVAMELRGTPVKLVFSREEDFAQDFPRQLSMARMKGVVANGKIVAGDFHVSSIPVMASWMGRMGMPAPGPDAQTPLGIRPMTYGIPNLRVTAYRAEGLSPISTWRSVGASSGGFFSEGFIDELIHAARLDPMQARIDMCEVDYHRKVIEAAAEMSNWNGPLGDGRGRGVAFVQSFGVPCCEVVDVTVTDKGIKIDKVYAVADVGPVLDPVNFENHVQGAVVWGLGHAINAELTYAGGAVEQRNYHAHEGMRMHQCPEIEVRGLANGPVIRGIGEPPVPPAAPALANAIFAATGTRLREMPFNKFIDFV